MKMKGIILRHLIITLRDLFSCCSLINRFLAKIPSGAEALFQDLYLFTELDDAGRESVLAIDPYDCQ